MTNDISKITFHPKKQYRKVRMQQERLLLDSEWNEELAMRHHQNNSLRSVVIGKTGVPHQNKGFQIERVKNNDDLIIHPGRIYVDGILCEIDSPTTYFKQPYYPEPDASPFEWDDFFDPSQNKIRQLLPGAYLVYLDVWQREVNYLDDSDIQEVSLGEADTTTRLQTVWQIKLFRLLMDATMQVKIGSWNSWIEEGIPTGKMSAQTMQVAIDEDPCSLTPHTGYQGLENQLYRIQIHQGNRYNQSQKATFKWSRDNGTVITTIEEIKGAIVTVSSLGKDELLGFAVGQWVEVVNEVSIFNQEVDQLFKIKEIDTANRIIELDKELPEKWQQLSFKELITGKYKLQRWDQGRRANENGIPISTEWIEIEQGIQLKFSKGTYRTGDYWLVPARSINASIEWPLDPIDKLPIEQSAHGIKHHYAKLARLDVGGDGQSKIEDCRLRFPTISVLNAAYVKYNSLEDSILKNKTNVQSALDTLYQIRQSACTYVISPNDNIQAVFDLLEDGASACICFQVGNYEIDRPIRITFKGHIKITGCGRGTKILCTSTEECFVFEACESVFIRDMNMESGMTETEEVITSEANSLMKGVLSFINCKTVVVEKSQLKCAWGASPNTSCVTIKDGNRIFIQDSEFLVGYLQKGIIIQSTRNICINNNKIIAYDCSDLVTFDQLIEFDEFLKMHQEFLINQPTLDRVTANNNSNLQYVHMEDWIENLSTEGTKVAFFKSYRAFIAFWKTVINLDSAASQVSNDEELTSYFLNQAKKIFTDPEYRRRTVFRNVFSQMYNLLSQQTIKLGIQGIHIEGHPLAQIQISNNNIDGFLQAINFSSKRSNTSETESIPNYNETMMIENNYVHLIFPPVLPQNENIGINIVNCERITFKNNTVILERLAGDFRRAASINEINQNNITGIQVGGILGSKILITKNQFRGKKAGHDFNLGILINSSVLVSPNTQWVVSWNLAAGITPLMRTKNGVFEAYNVPTSA